MPSFPPSHTPFAGLPASFLSQAEAPFGGSLEDAVARLQDGSLPAADVESLRELFASLLTTAGQGADGVGSTRQTPFAPDGAALADTDAAGRDLPMPWSADELSADVLAALGLPPGGQNPPDALPGADGSLDPAMAFGAAEPTMSGETVASSIDDSVPFGVSASAASPDASAAIAEDALPAPIGGDAEAAHGAAAPAVAFGAVAAASASSHADGAATPGETASAAAQLAATGIPGADADIAGGTAGVAGMAAGTAPDPAAAAAADMSAAELAAGATQSQAAHSAGATTAVEASAAAVQRLAALLAEMDAVAPDGAAPDEAWLREAMQRIDAALQSVRAGGGDAPALRSEAGSSALPAGLEALAARLLAAGDDAGRRLALLQEARQPAAGIEGAAAAAPTAQNPAAASAAGAERAPPALPLGLPLQHERWGEEVGERVRWMIGQQVQSAELKITPQHLGTIEVRISMHKDQMQISFVSPHAAVREALEDAAPRLREMMSAAGYAAVDVDVSHQEPSRQHDGGSRHWAGAGATAWGGEDTEVHESVGTIAPRAKGSLDCYA